jgi:hypothetical protein
MTCLLGEMAREALALPEEDTPVYVFLPPGPRHNVYGFREVYHDWLGRSAGERGCWKEQGEVDVDARALVREEVPRRSRGMLSAGGQDRGGSEQSCFAFGLFFV